MNIENSAPNKTVTGTNFKDTIENSGTIVKIVGNGGDDFINNYGKLVTINGGAGNDSIFNNAEDVTITGGEGDDYISSDDGGMSKVTISGGEGDDFFELWYASEKISVSGDSGNDIFSLGDSTKVLINYKYGDGDDTIAGFNSDDTLKIATTKKFTTLTSGDNFYVLFDNEQGIVLEGARSAKIVTVSGGDDDDDDGGEEETNSWKLSGTTATYGTSSKTLVTVKGVKSVDGLSLSGKVVTVADSSLNNSKVTISNGYKLKLASDVTKSSTKKAAWSYSNSIATYKDSSKTAGYSLASDGRSISYTKATSAKTLATVKGAKSKSGLSLSDKKITLKNSALKNKVTVSGSYEFDFASGYKNATINGSASADTITARGTNLKIFGGKGKDSLKMVGTNQTISGGDGADTFIYVADGGKERITDFSANDTLKIGADGDGTYSTVTSGNDVIVSTDDGGKITLVGAASKSLNIEGTKKPSGKGVIVSGRQVRLTSNFEDSSFSLSGNYSSAVTLDASAALLDLNLTGNKFANNICGTAQDDKIDGGEGADTIYGGGGSDSIFGGKGDDELHGGKGDDTLWGGAGADELFGDYGTDVFYYKTGEGNDTIFGYEASVDKIILGNGSISNVTFDRNNNVIFKIGDGQLVVNNAVDRTIKIVDSSGKILSLYEP